MDATALPGMARPGNRTSTGGSVAAPSVDTRDDDHHTAADRRDVHRLGHDIPIQQRDAVQQLHVTVLASIPRADLHRAAFWLNSLGEDWRGDVPLRLHSKDTTKEGTIDFSPEFARYIGELECKQPDCQECSSRRARQKNAQGWRNPESRLRATRAFRKLRKTAPREFDALYLYCISQFSISEIAKSLTERAIRLDKPERYTSTGVYLLLLSGIDKVIKSW